MSLQVWLPLRGSLDNIGLGTITNISGTPVYKISGKISNNAIDLKTRITFTCPAIANLQTFSIAFWGYPASSSSLTTNWQDLFGFTDVASGGTTGTFRWETCYANSSQYGVHWHDNSTNAIVNGSHYHSHNQDIWVHCCIVVDATAGKLYSYDNGVLTQTHNLTGGGKFNTAGTFYIGETNNIEGMLQDVRIYDHALSAKEVKEIAKGLVLHYPLNNNGFGQKNYLKNSNFLYGTNGLDGFSMNTNTTTCTKQIDCMKVVSTSSEGPVSNNYDDIAVDTMTTFSAYVKADSNMTIYIGVDGTRTNNCQSYTIGTNWTRISISKAKTTDNPYLRIYGNGTFYVKLLKYELGSIATNWCPNPADILASSIPYNNIVYDISGYNNHATVAGNLNTVAANVPRYNSVLEHLDSCADYMFIDALTFLETFTFACWVKCTNFTRTSNGTSAANAQFIVSQGRDYRSDDTQSYGANLRMYNGVPQWQCGDGVLSANVQVPLNTWCHIVGTYDGTTKKIYLNGVLKNSATDTNVNWDNNNSYKLVIGKMAHAALTSNIAYHPFVGHISDVRIYTTALSADDIAELYSLGCI